MKTFIRTFNANNAKIHDLQLNGGRDDVRVALFTVRRALAVNGFAVVVSQDSQIGVAVQDAFMDGYIGVLSRSEGAFASTDPSPGNEWHVTKVYSEAFASDEDAWYCVQDSFADLLQWADYRENCVRFYKGEFVIEA